MKGRLRSRERDCPAASWPTPSANIVAVNRSTTRPADYSINPADLSISVVLALLCSA
ncbi:MAG: hypothetical protein JNL18_07000 [Planctomycetaceae bacterium]|nr:hypothetical protein [Planctomycetaceae bacterium]